MNVSVKQTQFKYAHNNYFGGYITYWKLFFSMLISISQCSLYTKTQKIKLILHLIFAKGLWILFIKPLGFVVSFRNILEGTKIVHDGCKGLDTVKGRKTFIIYLFRKIPIFYIKKKFSSKDIVEILSK